MSKATKRASRARRAPVIDTHAHWFPPEWVALIEAEGNQNGAKVERTDKGLSLNLLRGSDYCFDMGYERPVQVIERIPKLSAKDRGLMLGGTAARLLKI